MDSVENAIAVLADIRHRAFRARLGLPDWPSPAPTVSGSGAGAGDALVFFVSFRLCLRISMRSTTLAGPGAAGAGTCGETPAIFIWMISSTLSWYSSLYLFGSNLSDIESI